MMMMKNVSIKFVAAAAACVLVMGSCTVSEPELPSGDGSSFRLKSITAMGLTVMKAAYDSSDRISSINFNGDFVYEFTYEGSSRVPSKIVYTEYDEDDSAEETKRVVSEVDTWTDIRANAGGCITAYKWSERNYYGERVDLEEGDATLTYDAANHLTNYRLHSTTNGTTEDRKFNWSADGLLLSCDDCDGYAVYFTYSDVDNVNLQWDPFQSAVESLGITGFLGTAPSKFFKTQSDTPETNWSGTLQYAYTLLDNGLIRMGKYYDPDEGAEIVYNFVYETK